MLIVLGTIRRMGIADVFLSNLRRLVGDMKTNQAATLWKVSQRTLASYVGGEEPERKNARIETLEELAEGIGNGLKPWHLLIEGVDLNRLPVLLPNDGEEAELLRLFAQLDPDTRPALLKRARSLCQIDEIEREPAPDHPKQAEGCGDSSKPEAA